MAASNDAKFARGLGEHGWQVLRPGTEPGSQRNHEAAEQAPTAKAIDDLAAPVGRGQHDGPSDTVWVVFGQISPQNQAPERMGHKVDLVAVQVHFVTHSFGGLVLRAYLSKYNPDSIGRAVMLAPPNGGSEIVDRFGSWRLFRSLMVPLAARLGTGPEDLPAMLPQPACEFGVIAGSHWINPIGPLCLPSPHDGTVSVFQTRLPGMKDHLVVPHNHTFIMDSQQVAFQVIHF